MESIQGMKELGKLNELVDKGRLKAQDVDEDANPHLRDILASGGTRDRFGFARIKVVLKKIKGFFGG